MTKKTARPLKYNEDSIEVLDGLEGCRRRPGMYIGTVDDRGILHCVKEIADNSFDESLAGNNDRVCVIVDTKAQTFTIIDNGRGIPVGIHKKTKISTLTSIFTTLHAGGKLNADQGGYEYSVGCFVGNTKIKLLNGKSIEIEKLYKNHQNNPKPFWVYSFNEENGLAFMPRKAFHVQLSKHVNKTCIVELDNGEKIESTLDHPYLTYEGKYVEAAKLKAGQSLRALHTYYDKGGYEIHNRKKGSKVKQYNRTQRTVLQALGTDIDGAHTHHKNGVKIDNRPSNLEAIFDRSEHFWEDVNKNSKHALFLNKNKRLRKVSKKNITLVNKKGKSKSAHLGKIIQCSARALRDYGKLTEKTFNKCRGWCYPNFETALFYNTKAELKVLGKNYLNKYGEKGRVNNGGYGLNYKLQAAYENSPATNVNNHQVVKVSIVKHSTPVAVYGMSVEGEHNYLLDAGVFVKNTHGVGSSVVMALSSTFNVWTFRDKKWWHQSFAKGKVTSKLINSKPPKNIPISKGGTVVQFTPDNTIFKGAKLPVAELHEMLKINAYLNPGVTVEFINTVKDKKYVYKFKKGVAEYVEHILAEKKLDKLGKLFEHRQEGVAIALQWSSFDDDAQAYYVNGSKVPNGTHVTGLQKAIADAIKPFAGKRAKYRPEDLRIGLIGVLNCNVSSPQFDSQTKSRLTSPHANELVYKAVKPALEKFFSSNKSLAKQIISRASAIREAVAEFKLSKQAATKLKTNSRGKIRLPAKLSSSITKNPKDRELFIVEGESAGGSAKGARDQNNQEVLPLKGKILNVYQAKMDKILNSDEILNILQSIGFDATAKDPIANLRVGKIILLSDADSDGSHINLLIAGLLQKLIPGAIEKGMVYYVDAPLFTAKCGANTLYGANLKDLQKQAKGKEIKNVVRMKGWGEADASVLKTVAFDPNTRSLCRLTPVKGAKLKEFQDTLSNDSDFKKVLLGIT